MLYRGETQSSQYIADLEMEALPCDAGYFEQRVPRYKAGPLVALTHRLRNLAKIVRVLVKYHSSSHSVP